MECGSNQSRSANQKRGRTISALSRSYSSDNFRLPSAGAFKPRQQSVSEFKMFYDRGDLPIYLESDASGNRLIWKTDVKHLDYRHYLPIFFDGLSETKHPYGFFAYQGVKDLIRGSGDRILPVLPLLILPLKRALTTRHPTSMVMALKVMQLMVVTCSGVGRALVNYCRQLLPTLNAFKAKNFNSGDEIEYGQRRRENMGDLIQETLECLEMYGGKHAFVNIRYVVPTYESCIHR